MAMNGYSDELANKLQGYFTGSGYTAPTAWYVGLGHTTYIESDGSGWLEAQVAGSGTNNYARKEISARGGAAPAWSTVGASPTFTVSNSADVEFPTCTASAWGSGSAMLCAAIWTSSTSTDPAVLIFGGALVSPKVVSIGTTAVFLTGLLSISCQNS